MAGGTCLSGHLRWICGLPGIRKQLSTCDRRRNTHKVPGSRETIKTIVDLRPQYREFEVNGWTKDGIKVILGVRVETRIGSDYSPDKADLKLLYPFDRISVRHAVEYAAVKEQGGKLIEAVWCEGATGKIKGLLAHYISSRRLDELYLIDRGNVQVLSADVLKWLLYQANDGLKKVGNPRK